MPEESLKKVSFYTLGCKLNFAETATLSRTFTDNGYQKVEFDESADVVVINTCSVTQLADKKCRQIISKASKISPDAIIAVVGCFAQLKPEEISHLKGVNLVLGTSEKFKILEHIHEIENEGKTASKVYSCEIDDVDTFNSSYSLFERTRSFLKIQDGCDYHCSYCTIPLARGKSRNTHIFELILEAEKIAASGIKEIVLTGVNIGDFGHSTGESFLELAKQLDKVDGIERIRISSIEPNLLTNEIIEFVAHSNSFVPHFHIPLQSGNNDILKLMRRRYMREVFQNRVTSIKQAMPHACIGADVIVGFPGETDELFNSTYSFIESLNLSYLHVFPYSERKNTPAVLLPGKVEPQIKDLRCQKLIELSENKRRLFYNENLGKKFPVLFEGDHQNGFMHGFTPNYVKCIFKFDASLINKTFMAQLMFINDKGDMNIELIKE
jgi:threonylcarbamoyladenosine tRNA methylthiotransferase MtaB